MSSSDEPSARRSGRRPGPTTTRDAIAQAARRQFAELGYDRATLRGIAGEAGVDAALVVQFYGSKDALFREVMALPPTVAEAMAALAEGPTAARIKTGTHWSGPGHRRPRDSHAHSLRQ